MEGRKAELLQRIESDREVLLDFFRRFICSPNPNPPGDTREAAAHMSRAWTIAIWFGVFESLRTAGPALRK
jgi:hypothetical protein